MQKAKIIALVLTLAIAHSSSKATLDKPIALDLAFGVHLRVRNPPIKRVDRKYNHYLTANMPLSAGKDAQTAPMILDLNYNHILIPVKAGKRTDGITCQESQTKEAGKCTYNTNDKLSAPWTIYEDIPEGSVGQTKFNWTDIDDLNEVNEVTFGALTGSEAHWATGKAGVMGLAPVVEGVSNFWTYMFGTYAPKDDTLYATFTLNSAQTTNLSWYQIFEATANVADNQKYGIFNGSKFAVTDKLVDILSDKTLKEEDAIAVANFNPSAGSQTWGLSNITLTSTDRPKDPLAKEVNACFAMNSNATILLKRDIVERFKDESLDAVCRSDECGPDSFILNGADLKITVKNENKKGDYDDITLTPVSYLFNNVNNSVNVSYGYLDEYEGAGCDYATSDVGLGRMFFYNYQVVLKVKYDGSGEPIATVLFFPYESRPTFAHYASVYTLVIAGIGFVLALFVCIMGLRWKGISQAGEEDEELENNGYNLAKVADEEN